jgi:uncharacterized protein
MIYEMTVPQYSKMLHNLGRLLDKGGQLAETKKFDVDVLLHSRLAPDQFNLIRQIQIATDTAKLSASRLSGKEAPKHDDTEKTLPELKARIESVIGYLATLSVTDFQGAEKRHITQPRWEGKHMLGTEYVQQHALPNFYFHITTAYSILRHNGVEIGKKDYLGDLPLKN